MPADMREEDRRILLVGSDQVRGRLNLGMRLHDTPQLDLEERLAYIERQGFTCAHAALGRLLAGEDSADAALTPGFALTLKRMFWNHGIDFAVLGCYLNLANPDPVQLAAIRNRYKAHIRFAAQAGCGVVGTETGAPNTEYRYVPECHTEEAFQAFMQGLRPVVAYAERMGVIVAVEPVFTHIVYTPKLARRLLDEVASPNLQIIFDPVNLLHQSNYENRKQIVRDAISLLGEDIAVLHIKDFKTGSNGLVQLAAGDGIMEYEEILRFVKTRKPFVHCTLEETVPENAQKAAAYIRNIYENIV